MSEEDNKLVIRYDRLPPEWKMNNVGVDATRAMQASLALTGSHGIYAGIPIICRGSNCPYIETCAMEMLQVDVATLVGQRCPVEVANIMKLYNGYAQQFHLEDREEDMVLIGLVKELIDYEIQAQRADHRMAAQGDFLEDIVVGVSDNGHPIVNKEIAKPIDYKERALKKKHEILQLLNSTPKDRASTMGSSAADPSSYAADLIQKEREYGEIIDVEAVEVDGEKPKKKKKS
jgi:hypothetical protein